MKVQCYTPENVVLMQDLGLESTGKEVDGSADSEILEDDMWHEMGSLCKECLFQRGVW